MISIIICSRDEARFHAVAANYARLLKNEPFEVVRITGIRSLCDGYTRGVAQSRGDKLIFSHDDIEILSTDLADRLHEHFENFDLFGVAGTNRMIQGLWIAAGPPYIFGQVAQIERQGGFCVVMFGVGRRTIGQIQAIDGLFFAARRSVVEKIPFDSLTFDGFHHYDMDFSFAAHLAGFRLGVVNDIHILHASWGKQDDKWYEFAARFDRKYAGRLYPMRPRPATISRVSVNTKEEIMEIMRENCRD